MEKPKDKVLKTIPASKLPKPKDYTPDRVVSKEEVQSVTPSYTYSAMGVEEAQSEVDDLEEMFSGEGQTESSILKELFNAKNVKVKTDLSADQISIVSRLYLMGHITKRPYLKSILDEFVTLRISLDRKSRQEFVEAHKERQKQQNSGFLNGLFGGQGNQP